MWVPRPSSPDQAHMMIWLQDVWVYDHRLLTSTEGSKGDTIGSFPICWSTAGLAPGMTRNPTWIGASISMLWFTALVKEPSNLLTADPRRQKIVHGSQCITNDATISCMYWQSSKGNTADDTYSPSLAGLKSLEAALAKAKSTWSENTEGVCCVKQACCSQ